MDTMSEPARTDLSDVAESPGLLAAAREALASLLGVGRQLVEALCAALASATGGFSSLVAGLALAACQRGEPPPRPEPAPERVIDGDAGAPTVEPNYGEFKLTFYYVIDEEEVDGSLLAKHQARGSSEKRNTLKQLAREEGTADEPVGPVASPDLLATVDSPGAGSGVEGAADPRLAPVTIYDGKSCEPIADISRLFAMEAELQGTGRLRDGRVINIWGKCACPRTPCFRITGSKWGTAGTGRPLAPFRTVAVDPKHIPLGTLLFIPELDGKTMPGKPPYGGFVHDGCVAADDTGGGIRGREVDLFVARRSHYQGLSKRGGSHAWARQVQVMDGARRCQRGESHTRWRRSDI